MSGDTCVRAWPCSYYAEPEKRWVPGRLALTARALRFTAEEGGAELAGVPLHRVAALRKEATCLIFGALTVLEQGGAKHWFSGLQPSRNAAFGLIEHFWREALLAPPGAAAATGPTTRGQALAGLMASSQRRLEDTARVLRQQGEQLDGIARGLDRMESDLAVADRLLTELESPSWWPFGSRLWKTPPAPKPPASGAAGVPGSARELLRVPVLVARGAAAQESPGSLAVLASGLEIRDAADGLVHRCGRADVDAVQVHSPYEVTVRQRQPGRPDATLRLTAARMPQALRLLEEQLGRKMPPRGDVAPGATGGSAWQAAARLQDLAALGRPASGGQDGAQRQLPASGPPISEGDAQELSQILRQLKGLALDAEAELERQDEALDGITAAVDRTTLTVDKHNRRMKRLT